MPPQKLRAYIVQGEKGSYVKYGLDPQEDRLKSGERLPQPDWGYDMRDGVLTLSHDGVLAEKSLLTIPGNYPAYYAGVRDAINGLGPNPVTAEQAIRVMELIELGIESAQQQKIDLSLKSSSSVIVALSRSPYLSRKRVNAIQDGSIALKKARQCLAFCVRKCGQQLRP